MDITKITIGQIATVIAFVVALIGGVEFLLLRFNKIFDSKLEPLHKKIDELDASTCKNYLVRFLSDIERGVELDEVEKQRAFEAYDRYTNVLKQNSYIHQRWTQLVEKEKDR